MGVVAVINREPDISSAEWLECISNTAEFFRRPARAITNPFTGLPATVTPPPTDVSIRIGDQAVGAVALEGDGELVVYAPEERVSDAFVRIVEATALALNAKVTWTSMEREG